MGRRGRPPYPDILTPREWEVLALLREGLTNEAIAARLGVSHAAAKYHVSQILSKLGVPTREEAAAWQPAPAAEATAPTFRSRGFPASAVAALSRWLRLVTLAKAALVTAAVAVLAGLGVLAWGVLRADGEDRENVLAPTPSVNGSSTAPPSPFPSPTSLGRVMMPINEISSGAGPYVVDVVSGQLYAVPRGRRWSPDGSKFALATGDGGLAVADISSGEGVQLVHGDIGGLDWSPDGTKLAFSFAPSGAGPTGLFVASIADGGITRLADVPRTWTVDWSPDGTWIIVDSGTFLIDAGTGDIQQIAASSTGSWLPSGAALVWAGGNGVFVYDVNKAENKQIASGQGGGPVNLSPDGTRVVMPYGERVATFAPPLEGAVSLNYVFDLSGAQDPIPLPPAFFVNWSPDSQRLAYVSYGCVTGEWDIYTISRDGGEPERITRAPEGIKEGAAWSPDGRMIAYSTLYEVRLVDVETGEDRLLAAGPSEVIGVHFHGDWSPDGRYLSFEAPGGHGVCD